jgi:bifunctional non-homologous end joining protein LigD
MVQSPTVWHLAGRALRLTHLDKPYWPEDGLTKGDLLAYDRDLAPVLLPYFADRPVTLRVFPEGIHGPSFYRRDVPDDAPPWLRHADYHAATADRVVQLPLIDDAAGLVWLANAGAIEFHLWSARLPDLAEPDQAIFDLDPGDQASFGDVLQAAVHLHAALEQVGLRGYAKTSGGRGLHVYLPLAPGHAYDDVRAWVKAVAAQLATAHPRSIAVPHGATHRGRQVAIDYAQNSIGRNTAAPYTVRALPGAPVSTPLTWEEVAAGQVRPGDLTLRTVPTRVRERGDPFAPVLGRDQHLPPLGGA